MGSGSSRNKEQRLLLETLHEHKGSINCMTVSEDGSLLVTGSDDRTARLWSALSDPTEYLGVLQGYHTGRITCVAVSGTNVFTGSEDATINKWDMYTSECLYTYTGHMQQIHNIICTDDLLLSTSYDKTVKVWRVDADAAMDQEEACVRTFQGHHKAVYPVIFLGGHNTGDMKEKRLNINPGDLVITGSTDTTARSWSLHTGCCLQIFKQHSGSVTSLEADNERVLLYTGSADGVIKVWSISGGRCLKTLEGHQGSITCLKVVKRLVYSGSNDTSVKCWVRHFGECTRTYTPTNSQGSVICLTLHHGILFVGYTDHVVRAFEVKSGSMKQTYRGHAESVNCLAICGNHLHTASSDGTLRVWDVSRLSGEVAHDIHDPEVRQTPVDLDQYLDVYLGDDVDPASTPEDTTVDEMTCLSRPVPGQIT
ncbi:uncharacterized protein [Panulirus ornatus]|uniref:uncharacterized protein n=1 Tax=Panulirus ornatus TaxID=150431 RepID=UPI003A8544F1